MGEVKYSVFMQTHLILAAGMERSPPVTRAGGGDNDIDEREVAAENSRAPSRARRSSLENDPFFARGPWATRTGTLTRLPSLVRPRPLTMPFGDVGMASTTVVSIRRLVAAVAMKTKRRRGGGWSMGSRGSNYTRASTPDDGRRRGRASDPTEAAGAEILWLAAAPPLPHASVESLQKESYGGKKKSYFPPKVGNIPGEVGKNSTQKSGTIVLGTVVSILCRFSR